MKDRYLYRGKRTLTDNMWVYWDGFSGVQPNTVIEEETICQCTGLKDKSGRRIFENDIMEAHLDDEFPEDISRFKVEWSGNGWVSNQPGCADREYISDFETEMFEVCGNTIDNPELLEG